METRESIKRLRQARNWTQEQLAEKLGVARSTVTQWESGWSQPRMGMVRKLADVFGVTPSAVIGDTDSLSKSDKRISIVAGPASTVPIVGRLHAGDPQDIEDVDRTMEVPTSVLEHHPKSYGWIVEGDCMDRVYPEGCMILIDTAMEPQDGSIGAIRLDGYQEVMRRIHKGANTLILSPESWNPEHKDIVITQDSETTVEFVGTVVWFQASEEMD